MADRPSNYDEQQPDFDLERLLAEEERFEREASWRAIDVKLRQPSQLGRHWLSGFNSPPNERQIEGLREEFLLKMLQGIHREVVAMNRRLERIEKTQILAQTPSAKVYVSGGTAKSSTWPYQH